MNTPSHTILVPIDESKTAQLAFERALKITQITHSDLHLVHVIDPRSFQNTTTFSDPLLDAATTKVKNHLAAMLAQAQANQIESVDYAIEYGIPKMMIAHDLVDRYHPDLIIMGANGTSTLDQLIMGSVTEYVSKKAPCDVLVVKNHSN